jgi:hypothetical protein
VVRLNRYGNSSERGRFRCEVPNAAGDNVTVYVNIGEWFVSLSTTIFYKFIHFMDHLSSGHIATSYQCHYNYPQSTFNN